MEISELVQTVRPYSMATAERLTWMAIAAKTTVEDGTPGVFVECGVCNGGSGAILAHYAVPAGRDVHLFDSWQGLPPVTEKDTPSFGTNHPAQAEVGKCLGDIEKVEEILHQVRANTGPGVVHFHKGWFNERFPQARIDQIAMLNLDSDWYESEKLCLETWYDKVSDGGYIYFDDFYYWPGCQRAARDFFREQGIVEAFHKVGHSAWIKKGELFGNELG